MIKQCKRCGTWNDTTRDYCRGGPRHTPCGAKLQEPKKKAAQLLLCHTWTQEELAAIDALAAKQELSPSQIIRQALRHYQLHLEEHESGSIRFPNTFTGD